MFNQTMACNFMAPAASGVSTLKSNFKREFFLLRLFGLGALAALSGCGTSSEFAESPGVKAVPSSEVKKIRTADIVGKWHVAAAAGSSCKVFMTMIKWSDGQRATARGCNSESLKTLRAWTYDGAEVVLTDKDGKMAGQLLMTKDNRLKGQLADGSEVSLIRGEGSPKVASAHNAIAPGKTDNTVVQQTDLVGGWQFGDSSSKCELVLGGKFEADSYEASTRDCKEADLEKITAWQFKNQRVVLLGESRRTLARLSSADGGTFNGRLVGGKRVSMWR